MKKIMSFILCLAIALTSSMPIFATNHFALLGGMNEEINIVEELGTISKDSLVSEKNANYIKVLDNLGIKQSELKDISFEEESIVYTYSFENGAESIIEISEKDNGDKVFKVNENQKTDEIIITSDGRVFSDDIEMVIENDNKLIENNIRPMSTSYNTENCPKGRPSDYTDYYRSDNNRNIALSKKLSYYTVVGLSILLSGLSGTQYLAGVSYAIASELIYEFGDSDPDSMGLSYEADIYSHKDGPQYGTIYRKMDTTWYSRTNYSGSRNRTVTYRVTEYY